MVRGKSLSLSPRFAGSAVRTACACAVSAKIRKIVCIDAILPLTGYQNDRLTDQQRAARSDPCRLSAQRQIQQTVEPVGDRLYAALRRLSSERLPNPELE